MNNSGSLLLTATRCLCGNEFCYVCGSRWKTCRCDPADMNRIEERTDDARSQVAPAIARNAEPMDTDSEVSDDFAVNPAACDHSGDFETIQFARNRFRCEECEEHQMNYISRCTRCQRNFCRTCHRAAQAPTRPGYIEPGIGKALGLFLDG